MTFLLRMLSVVYREEARFFWDKQEKRWKEEQEARSKLIADTLATLQLQVDFCLFFFGFFLNFFFFFCHCFNYFFLDSGKSSKKSACARKPFERKRGVVKTARE